MRPIRSDAQARLLQSIANARGWLGEVVSSRDPDLRAIAERKGCSERHVRPTLTDIVRASA